MKKKVGKMKNKAIRSENVDMSNEKGCEKQLGRKFKGSNIVSNVSWVKTVPNQELKGERRWEKTKDRMMSEARRLRYI